MYCGQDSSIQCTVSLFSFVIPCVVLWSLLPNHGQTMAKRIRMFSHNTPRVDLLVLLSYANGTRVNRK